MENGTESESKSETKSSSGDRSSVQFPSRLHELLSEVEKNGNDSIISWLPGTDAFKVHNKARFTSEILPTYFNATKYKSFQRNLNLWGFETIQEGPNKGACFHRLFIRDDREKCHYMTRQKVKGNPGRPNQHTSNGNTTKIDGKTNKSSGVFETLRGTTSLSALADLASQAKNSSLPSAIPAEEVKGKTSKIEDLKSLPFPKKLHHFLARLEFIDCICWTPDGRCIRVVDPFKFQEKVATLYFSHNSFSSFLVELESYGFKKVTHLGFQECFYHDLMIRGCPHLTKYMNDSQASRKFISKDPKQDLEVDHAFGSPIFRDPLMSSPSSANLSQIQNVLEAQSAAASSALVQEIQHRQQLALLLAGGSAGQPATAGLGSALGLGSLFGGAAVAAARRASLPTTLGLGQSPNTIPGSASENSSSNKLPISSFLANSSQSGGASSAPSRSEAV